MGARLLSALAAAGLLLAACSSDAAAPAPSPASDRVAEVRAARAAVRQPAARVSETAAALAAGLERLYADGPDGAEDRLAAVEAVRTRQVAALRDALGALEQVELTGEGPDVAAARQALDALARAARRFAAAAGDDLDRLARLARVRTELRALTATWDQPGSRSQQLERLAATAEDAEALAQRLATATEHPPCSGALGRRADAARFVASASRELRDLVRRYAGREYDRRRAELSDDPFGLGAPLVELDRDEAGCWRENGAAALAAEVEAAVDDLVAALNPADLARSTPTRG